MEQKDSVTELATNLDDESLVACFADYISKIPKVGPKVIVLVGAPASGKSVLVESVAQRVGNAAVLSTDNYVVGDRSWRRSNVDEAGKDPLLKYNPELLNQHVRQIIALQEGEKIHVPKYDDETGIAIGQDPNIASDTYAHFSEVSGPKDFIIVEGDFQFLDPALIDRMIFLDTEDDVRLENRLHRDTVKRKEHEDPEVSMRKTRANFVYRQSAQHIPHTLPNRDLADMIIKVHAQELTQPTPETKFSYTYDVLLK